MIVDEEFQYILCKDTHAPVYHDFGRNSSQGEQSKLYRVAEVFLNLTRCHCRHADAHMCPPQTESNLSDNESELSDATRRTSSEAPCPPVPAARESSLPYEYSSDSDAAESSDGPDTHTPEKDVPITKQVRGMLLHTCVASLSRMTVSRVPARVFYKPP